MEVKELERAAVQIRRDIVRMVHSAQSGHPGGSLGCVEFFAALYFDLMDYSSDPFQPNGENEDLFFLSNGHISPVYYSTLARTGHFPIDELGTFREINGRLQGHPTTHEGLPGIRIASGSLGQGMSVAIGAALTKKLNKDPKTVYCLHGDGELQEGQIWEAAMFAAGKKVDNLIATIDANGQQIDGSTDDVLPMGNIGNKFASFGWQVIEVEKGNDMQSVLNGLNEARQHLGKGKPICVVMKTDMGHGVDFMAGTHKWHGIPPNDEQLQQALAQLPETLGDYA